MDYNTKKEFTDIINTQIIEIFRVIFDVEVNPIKDKDIHFNHDDLVSKIRLHQDSTEILLRFGFPRETLVPLLKKMYDPIMATHESTLEDAVSEISNIACSGLKKHLNENGHNFSMDLPVIDCSFSSSDEHKDNSLYMNFMLQNNGFTVGLNMDGIEQEKGIIK